MNISNYCRTYDMLPIGSHILVAVSGGKDSMCLLSLLLSMKERRLKVSCAHFDHQLRGEASSRDREFVEEYCSKRGIPCYTGHADVNAYAIENALGIEMAARTLRYEFLEKTAEDICADRIATAHTADDNAETLLFNFSRGSGLKGLCAIPPVRGKIVRPLLNISSVDILRYLDENHLPHVGDLSNAEDFCARNRIRHKIIPSLRKESSCFDENATRCISLLREDNDYLESVAQHFLNDYYDGHSLPSIPFAQLKRPISARVLKNILGPYISSAHIESIRKIARGDSPHASTNVPGMRVFREYDRLIFGSSKPGKFSPRFVAPGDSFDLSPARLHITCNLIPKCSKVYNSVNNFYFKSNSICDRIVLRSRLAGDEVRLNGRNCTKSLKKLFTESKLNGEMRDLIPVFSDGSGVIAVYGFGIAERCIPVSGDDVTQIQIKKHLGENIYDRGYTESTFYRKTD